MSVVSFALAVVFIIDHVVQEVSRRLPATSEKT